MLVKKSLAELQKKEVTNKCQIFCCTIALSVRTNKLATS
jgi:hypothetical protein